MKNLMTALALLACFGCGEGGESVDPTAHPDAVPEDYLTDEAREAIMNDAQRVCMLTTHLFVARNLECDWQSQSHLDFKTAIEECVPEQEPIREEIAWQQACHDRWATAGCSELVGETDAESCGLLRPSQCRNPEVCP